MLRNPDTDRPSSISDPASPGDLPGETLRTLVLENMAEGVSVCDEAGIITYTNPAFDQMFGYGRHELLGRHVTCLNRGTSEEENQRIFGEIADRLHREGNWSGEFENLRKDGRPLATFARISTLESGSRRLWITVQEDITERKEAENRLIRANRELDAFAHTLSHDLRTPLTVILGFAEVLRDQCGSLLDRTGRSAVEAIEQQGERMLAMMEDLLVLARLGGVQEPEEPVEGAELVREVLCSLGMGSPEAGPEVRILALPQVRMSRTLLTQLFANLLDNARRHAATAKGPIEVGGEREGRRIRFFVRDRGPGIPPDERKRIFDLFYRCGVSGRTTGSGVGLATVQKIATHYDGRAWVEETPGGGATFLVEMIEPDPGAED